MDVDKLSKADRAFLGRLLTDPLTFADSFFRDEWFEGKGPPPFAGEVYDLINEKHPFTAGILPRGFAKSTLISQAYAMFHVYTNPGDYCIIATSSPGLRDDISLQHDLQIRTNERLIETFGEQANQGDSMWNMKKRVLRNGSELRYATRGESIRGGKTRKGKRPNLVIMDDIERGEDVSKGNAADHAKETLRWFSAEVEPALAPGGRIILVNNIISTLAFTNQVAERKLPGWRFLRWAACNFETGELLWPDHPMYGKLEYWHEKLHRLELSNMGHTFYAEYMNQPKEEVDRKFTAEMIRRWRWDQLFDGRKPLLPLRIFCAIDLAYKKKKSSDKTAWVVGVTDWRGNLYILEARKKQLSLTERENLLFDLRDRYGWLGLSVIHVEGHSDFFDSVTREQERKRQDDPSYQYFAVEELKTGGVSKTDRISELSPNMRTIFFLEDSVADAKGEHAIAEEVRDLVTELLGWTTNSTVDDLSDAATYLRRIAIPASKPQAAPAGGFVSVATKRAREAMSGSRKGLDLSAKRPNRG